MPQPIVRPTQEKVPRIRPGTPGACPSCGHHDLSTLYEVRRVPVHSCLLLDSAAEARAYPRGDLRLAFCERCGFCFNDSFQPKVHEYSPRCEQTQGFSPTFHAFARDLAQRLADRCDLAGKTVLEIGCGNGEFLVLLCRLAGCTGIGIDPSYVPHRTGPDDAARVQFIQDFYGPKYAHLAADLVVCRHTLEHIAPVRQFVRDLRLTLGDRPDTQVCFEVPDVQRILHEGAFWDLYYEHCSYFSAGAHARLFRSCGFEVTDLSLEYGGQYVVQMARPAKGPGPAALPLENDLDVLRAAAARFPRLVQERVERWRTFVRDAAARGRRVVLWGSGAEGVAFLTTLDAGDAIPCVVDTNPSRQGKFLPGAGQPIVGPEFLRQQPPQVVILMNPIDEAQVRQTLQQLGLQPDVLPVGAP